MWNHSDEKYHTLCFDGLVLYNNDHGILSIHEGWLPIKQLAHDVFVYFRILTPVVAALFIISDEIVEK